MSTIELDRRYNWHPFTPTDSWMDPAFKPISIVRARGSIMTDEEGKSYLDGNSSIWTITHGHLHPAIVQALREQLDLVEHLSFLGLTHPWSAKLAEKLSHLAGGDYRSFFSDDGSTAMETAMKIVWQYFQQNDQSQRRIFISLQQGYHGDTVGAMSLGHSEGMHSVFSPLLFETHEEMAPVCYRCPFNTAKPTREESRKSRSCNFECAQEIEATIESAGDELAAVVMEPRVQGAAGMWMHPEGYLKRVANATKSVGAKLVLDEVFTGFGRTGSMFAAEKEGVKADVVALGKGLTGGMLPLAATLVKEEIFQGFRGALDRAFLHGHSYTANPLGCVAALANLEVYDQEQTLQKIKILSQKMKELSQRFWEHPHVGDVRQEGLILAVELVKDFETREPYPWTDRLAFHVSEKARDFGLITRGIGNVLVLIPPYGTTETQLAEMIDSLWKALQAVIPPK